MKRFCRSSSRRCPATTFVPTARPGILVIDSLPLPLAAESETDVFTDALAGTNSLGIMERTSHLESIRKNRELTGLRDSWASFSACGAPPFIGSWGRIFQKSSH